METKEQTTLQKVSGLTGFTEPEIGIISNTVAKGTTPTELAYFLSIAKATKLNPFTKQIWCYKDHKSNLIILTGRDGFLTIAQRDPKWNGMISSEVHENDTFEVDVIEGKIKHNPQYKDRGKLLGAYCLVKPKGIDIATYEWADIETYDKGQFIWKSHRHEMIKKVAEIHALKKAFGIDGLYGDVEMIPQIEVKEEKEQITDAEILEMIDECYDTLGIKSLQRNYPKISMNGKLMAAIALKKKSFENE